MTADEISAFMGARFDDEERLAREAAAGPAGTTWDSGTDGLGLPYVTGAKAAIGNWLHSVASPEEPEYGPHIARHDPARVLRRVEADRRILARHTPHSMGACRRCEAPHWGVQVCNHCDRQWPCPDVRDLAAPHNEHPNYQPEWRPA